MSFDDGVAWAYGLTNALRLVSYAPQIWRVARDTEGAAAISCLSWNLWVAANATTALYAWTKLHDAPLAIMSAGNAVCCLSVVIITLAKRTRLRRARTVHHPACHSRSLAIVPHIATIDGTPAKASAKEGPMPNFTQTLMPARLQAESKSRH